MGDSRGLKSHEPSVALRLATASAVLTASDPPDLAAWAALLTDNVHLRVGNRAPALTRSDALAELERLFTAVLALGRGFRAIWPGSDAETLLMELDLLPRAGPALPLCLVLRTVGDGQEVQDARFYLDTAPLAAFVCGSAH